MSISLILIGVISLIVIAGTGYLFISKHQDLNNKKKGFILMIVGTVIFLSFLVTTFKHRNLGFKSTQYDQGILDVNQVFFGNNCLFQYHGKYHQHFQIPQNNIKEMYKRNYLSLYDKNIQNSEQRQFLTKYQQNILFLSKKDQGASYYLNYLAKKICKEKKNPVIYLNLDRQMNRQRDFLKLIGVSSFQQLQRNYCHFSNVEIKVNRNNDVQYQFKQNSKRKIPYLIIDNFQHILLTLAESASYSSFYSQNNQAQRKQHYDSSSKEKQYVGRKRLLEKILKQLGENCRANIILNTQKEQAIEDLYNLWLQGQQDRGQREGKDVFPFEYHRWQGLKQYDLFKIISQSVEASDYQLSQMLQINKQESYTFKDLFILIQQLKRKEQKNKRQKYKIKEGKTLQQWDFIYQIAKYNHLDKAFKYLKQIQDRNICKIKEKISYNQLRKLQDIQLIEIRKGKVYIK